MIDVDLVQFIKDQATNAGNRIHTGNAPQSSSFPVVIVRRTAGNTPRVLGGQKLNSRAQFAIDVIGRDYATVLPVATQVRNALDGFRGDMGASTVMSARCLAEPADFSEIDGDQTFRRVSQDFFFVYSEAG